MTRIKADTIDLDKVKYVVDTDTTTNTVECIWELNESKDFWCLIYRNPNKLGLLRLDDRQSSHPDKWNYSTKLPGKQIALYLTSEQYSEWVKENMVELL